MFSARAFLDTFNPCCNPLKNALPDYHKQQRRLDSLKSTLASIRVQKRTMKLNAMLSNLELSTIITWMPHGLSWMILKPKKIASTVVPQSTKLLLLHINGTCNDDHQPLSSFSISSTKYLLLLFIPKFYFMTRCL